MEEPIQLTTMTIDLSQVDEIYRDGDILILHYGGSDLRLSHADSAALCTALKIIIGQIPDVNAPPDDLPEDIPF